MPRVAAFIDGSNLYFTQKDMGWNVDFIKLRKKFESYGDLVFNTYYVGENAPPDVKEAGFHTFLMLNGYSLETKTVKEFTDEDGTKRKKANLDIEIVLDMFNQVENYDLALLASGDGDFHRPLQLLRARGKRFFVFSTPKFAAREIRMLAGPDFKDLTNLKAELSR